MKSGARCKCDISFAMSRPETHHGTCTYTDACASAISKYHHMFMALNDHIIATKDPF